MKFKNEIVITLIITMLVLFLRFINVFQIENGLGNPFLIISMIICFSFVTIFIQKNIDRNYKENKVYYQNLDILKYISAILIMILHLRPFLNFSDQLDLTFNNIITRICVPIFFIVTGYFVAKKQNNNENYITDYVKRTIPLYLVWSLLYLPILIGTILQNLPIMSEYLSKINIALPLLIILSMLLLPVVILIALCYTGIYYHLWYFPAIIFSLLVLKKWTKKFNIKYLLAISFILLLFGATETYYGVLPVSIKDVLSYYYNIFFTTRNFLFFGLFYVVLGYFVGTKEKAYSKYCFTKLIISFFLLVFEAILLHDTNRLNSNILLSCVPLTYYLFISVIYITNKIKLKFQFGNLSKYYYLLHPMVIFIMSLLIKDIGNYPYLNIFMVLLITHIISILIIKLKKKNKKLII
ncbi:peptidoglycan/LPS O-acetylase OafA/YrhL [Breznakia blatticola]|uniref:Peptidoglycan/LPS O-acetylase OafA/YrhL n=1 Tax=Breznakia blatticola TaxID=1754012 RepID=A0A4R7ZQV9_9FIRM|nr:acyltransferase family protein [Breznakia blatticola]TDW20329.1 peptidoglycan/LPS O-acetylase OafA/YrhL [Breznakia blatticola]